MTVTVLSAPATRTSAQAPQAVPIAPELDGLGTLHMPVTTSVPRAQRFFDQGLRLLYAFNHAESIRAFREAARLDPELSMAYWGEAIALGPNLNAPMTQENGRQAYAAIRQALKAAFYPEADDWKRLVWQQGIEACRQALEGLQEPAEARLAAA